jgi:hypothetical protein
MDELIAQCHATLEQVERNPLLGIGKAIAVARSTLAMVTELNARLARLEAECRSNG